MKQFKTAIAVSVLLAGVSLVMSGCNNNAIDFNKAGTLTFDPEKDKPLSPGGGPGSKGAGPAMKGKKGAPAAGGT